MLSRLELYIAELQADPIGFLITMLYTWGVILFSLILHECAHGYVAMRCGDPTAKMLGRLSLNPARHLDPLGTLSMFLIGFGWAKPVPVNPRNFGNPRRDHFLVSIAGITVNLTIFVVCVLLTCVVNRIMMGQELVDLLQRYYMQGVEVFISPFYEFGNGILNGDFAAMANGLPVQYAFEAGTGIVQMSGMPLIEKYFAVPWLLYVQRLLMMLAQVNLSLALFNLLPIPPLDGSRIVTEVILNGKFNLNGKAQSICSLIMVGLIVTGVLSEFLGTAVLTVYEAVLKTFLQLTGQMA